MSYRKFKFVSPGIFITEIDNSQLPKQPTAMGPAIIGRTARGPALKPIQVNSFEEFLDIFGKPIPGGQGGDVWRYGNFTAPTYAAYAAQAWLRNNSPVTMVRLLGQTNKDATSDGYAGWKTDNTGNTDTASTNGGAFGLFICEADAATAIGPVSASMDSPIEGTLAAIWYLNKGAIALSGQTILTGSSTYDKACATWMRAVDTGPAFKVVVQDSDGNTVVDSSFDFDSKSPRFIRKVFNTNPTLTNSTLNSTGTLDYWLGESFEGHVNTFVANDPGGASGISGSAAGSTYGIILPLASPNGDIKGGDFTMSTSKSPSGQFAKTGWFITQDIGGDTASYNPEAQQKLFRLCARELGEETQRKIKISLQDIKVSPDPSNPYGSFTVAIRNIKDIDTAPDILEQYNNCSLNPASDNYIAKKIGNKYEEWNDTDRRYRYYGDYANVSDYVYVEMNEQVDAAATTAEYLPFGVFGPPRYKGFAASGSAMSVYNQPAEPIGDESSGSFIRSGSANPITTHSLNGTFFSSSEGTTVKAQYKFPLLRLRASSSEGNLTDAKDAYFGVDTTYSTTHARFDASVYELLRTKADDINGHDANGKTTEASWVFSLDDVRNITVSASSYTGDYKDGAVWQSGSRANGISFTAHTGSGNGVVGSTATTKGPATASYQNVIDDDKGGVKAGWNRFTTCLHGGADGVDITEMDPFNNAIIEGKTELNSSAYNAFNVVIDSIRDSEIVEYNLVTAPGMTNNTLNSKLVQMCENRADALAIIDLKNGYTPRAESDKTRSQRKGNLTNVVSNKKNNLLIDSSYGCAYYPWVQIRDTVNGATLWAPPSIAALGAMSYGEATAQLWFAPAGFTRGGLSANRAAGVPVVGVEQRLTSKERDKLYEANINPIAAFPAEGIVIFGQKTLQLTPSALDRINVRRLVIYLKKQISRFAATVLFDQNVQTTWNRFKSKVEPFLSDVKAGLGITEYRLILDETTTTPDLIDRNIMYAKIYVKPARAIEFIAIDFIITDSGASFED